MANTPPRIFISYRRSDTQMAAGRLRESLASRIGEDAIFRDKNSIPAGEDWKKAIQEGLAGDVVVLTLIGPNWVSARDEAGHYRLEDPADWNRVELEFALKRRGRVVPLLVDDTKMPAESELPESLKALASANALPLRDNDWDSDIDRLVRGLGIAGLRSAMRTRAVAAAVAVAVIATAAGGWWWYTNSTSIPDDPTNPNADSIASTASHAASTYRRDILAKLGDDQIRALRLLDSNRPEAIRLIDANLADIDEALKAFPGEAELHALEGFAAKNVYASAEGILPTAKREEYLARARSAFTRALELNPNDPSAVNGMGNVLYYEGRFNEAIEHHTRALKLAGGQYPEAEQDLKLVRQVKNGEIPGPAPATSIPAGIRE